MADETPSALNKVNKKCKIHFVHYILYYCFCAAKCILMFTLAKTRYLKQIFPEKELWGLSPIISTFMCLSDLYIPMIGLPILLQEICGPILGIYKSLTDT